VSADTVTLTDHTGAPKLWAGDYHLEFTNGNDDDAGTASVTAHVQ
jgi:hypothetical protein